MLERRTPSSVVIFFIGRCLCPVAWLLAGLGLGLWAAARYCLSGAIMTAIALVFREKSLEANKTQDGQ